MRLHRVRELSAKIVIDSGTHSVEPLRFMRYGANQGRVEELHILNILGPSPPCCRAAVESACNLLGLSGLP